MEERKGKGERVGNEGVEVGKLKMSDWGERSGSCCWRRERRERERDERATERD